MQRSATGIILAGGKSSRMGKDKGLVLINERPLVDYAVDVLLELTDDLIISTGNPYYGYLGFPLVEDEFREIGPMGGIYSALKHSSSMVNLVIPCDMPLIHPDLFRFLFTHLEDHWVVLPSSDGKHPEPMCGIYRKEILPVMIEFISKGNYKLPDLFKEIPYKMVPITGKQAFFSEWIFMNINSLEDLGMAEHLLRMS